MILLNALVFQHWIEYRFPKSKVVGSNPTESTNFKGFIMNQYISIKRIKDLKKELDSYN